ALGHLLHHDGAKPAALRRRYGWPTVLRPVHREGLSLSPPADLQAPLILRERSVFTGVGGKFVDREPDGLCGSRLQAQLGAMYGDARTNEAGEWCELSANQVLDANSLPVVPNKEVLNSRKRLDAFRETLKEIFRIFGGGLLGNRVHHAQHVLGAVADLAHQEA